MSTEAPLPTFLIIGAMKSGTSSLWAFTRRHPEVFMPDKKEIEFFSHDHVWSRGLEWYAKQFAGADVTHKALGEASTSYTKYPQFRKSPERIAQALPDVRFVYLVREPVERMRSQWEHVARNWGEKRPLDVALREDPRYLNLSRYATQLERYLEYFERDRFLVIKSEDLKAERATMCARVFRFIGVDAHWQAGDNLDELMVTSPRRRDLPTGAIRKRGRFWRAALGRVPEPAKKAYRSLATGWRPPARPEVSPEVAEMIRTELRDEVARLRGFMGEDFDGWGIA